jgi:hypothetical protein
VSSAPIIGRPRARRKARRRCYGNRCYSWDVTAAAFDPYLVDTLMRDLVGHDRQPSAFLVYLLLWRKTHAAGADTVQIALLDVAEATGLSKRAVQDAIAWLAKRRLVAVARTSITAIPVYTVLRPWRERHRGVQ